MPNVTIYNGPIEDPGSYIGFIQEHDLGFDAFDAGNAPLGGFAGLDAATDAIEFACLGVRSRSNGGGPNPAVGGEPDPQPGLAQEAQAAREQPQSVAVTFLEKLRPGGPWVLTAIVPDGPATTVTAHTADQVEAFVREHDGKAISTTASIQHERRSTRRRRRPTSPPSSTCWPISIPRTARLRRQRRYAIWRSSMAAFEPKPTGAVDSGNGIQGLWKLKERIILGEPINGKFSPEDQAKIDDVEARIAA